MTDGVGVGGLDVGGWAVRDWAVEKGEVRREVGVGFKINSNSGKIVRSLHVTICMSLSYLE